MNYSREMIDALAAEYVLGTLRSKARARFAALMRDSREAREAVWRWEEALNAQAMTAAPMRPDDDVWTAIERRINPGQQAQPFRRGGSQIWLYRLLSGGLAAIIAVLLINPAMLVDESSLRTPLQPPGQLALIQDEASEPLWLIRFDRASGAISSRALNVPAQDLSNAYQLWALVDGVPQSLGLLPVAGNNLQQDMPPALTALLGRASGLAVSLEPAGGSPTGQPTGPVLYQAQLVEL